MQPGKITAISEEPPSPIKLWIWPRSG